MPRLQVTTKAIASIRILLEVLNIGDIYFGLSTFFVRWSECIILTVGHVEASVMLGVDSLGQVIKSNFIFKIIVIVRG